MLSSCRLHNTFQVFKPQNDDTFFIIDIKIEWQGCIEALAGGGGWGWVSTPLWFFQNNLKVLTLYSKNFFTYSTFSR